MLICNSVRSDEVRVTTDGRCNLTWLKSVRTGSVVGAVESFASGVTA
jgi:hypothetical protein